MASIEQPKKAPAAYWLYLTAHRAEIEKAAASKKGSDVAKKAGEMWKAASAEERKPFEEEAAKRKAEYDQQLKAFKEDGGVITRKSKKQKDEKKPKKDPNAPKKPAGGGYGQFLAENREEITKSLPADHKITDVAKAAGGKWKALSEAEQAPYNAKFTQKMEEYKKAKEEYDASHPQEQPAESPSPAKKATKRAAEDSGEKKARATKKRAAEDAGETKAPVAKRGRKSIKSSAKDTSDGIDAEVLAAAKKLGYDSQLKNLLSRAEVAALGLPADKMLSALTDANGLVNAAKRALLAGA